ncbi:MAG: hypothetical protein LBL83_10560 [Clostridiales bacterium]|jgi:hypothetical protein|nr:hypothetical protein [Clostridiales bacterium]
MSKKAVVILVAVAIVIGVALGGISKLTGIDFNPLLIIGGPVAFSAIGGAIGTAIIKARKNDSVAGAGPL